MNAISSTERKNRVLVIDDGLTMRLFYRSVLEAAGFEVEEAANGVEGVERAIAGTFDLLLVDINMPKMNGYEVIAALRRDEALWRLPLITISSEDKDQDITRAYQAGANFYLVKPVSRDQLSLHVAALLGRRAA